MDMCEFPGSKRRRLLQSQGPAFQSQGVAGVPTQDLGNGNITTSDGGVTPSPSPSPSPPPSPSPLATIFSPSSPPLSQPSLESFPESPTPLLESSTSSEKKANILLIVMVTTLGVILSIVFVVVFFCYCHKGTTVRPWKSSMSGELQKGFSKGKFLYYSEEHIRKVPC